jgi:hypothetical protein
VLFPLLLIVAACGTNLTPQPMPAPALPSCVPNRDGMIEASELPIALGFALDYYAGANRTVDLVEHGGLWDFSVERPDDTVVALGPIALGDGWFASSFPGGQFAVDAGGGLLAVYHQDDTALWLDGFASSDPSPAAGKTLVRYASPVAALRFPLADMQAWSATGAIAGGTIDGLPFVGSDAYDVDVTGSGQLDVPYVDFSPVLRIRTHLTRTPSTGTPVVGKRTTIFMFECFGEVARAESNANEPNADFTTAALLRRFALGVSP